jgi:hypothetical protein
VSYSPHFIFLKRKQSKTKNMFNSEEDYTAYLQEQAYLQAQGQAEYEAWIAEQEDWYYSIQDRYHYATVKWFPTGDPTPVYLVVLAALPSGTIADFAGTILECVVLKSYNEHYANREKVDVPASAVEVIDPEITKFNPNVDF